MKTESYEHARDFGKITREDAKSKSYIPQTNREHVPEDPSLFFPGIFQLLLRYFHSVKEDQQLVLH